MKNGVLFLFSLALSFILCEASAANKSTQKKVLTRKISSLAFRNGYDANKAWDETIEKAATKNDSAAYDLIFSSMKGRSGFQAAEYSFDLAKLFKLNPNHFAGQSDRFFSGNYNCIIYWLVPSAQEVQFSEIEAVARAAPPTKSLTALMRGAKYRFEGLGKRDLDYQGCEKYFY